MESKYQVDCEECDDELAEDEREELELGIDNALDQCFYCLYGLNLRSDSSREEDLVTHKNTRQGDYQTKEQCAEGYLAESQRHDKAGYSLTKLLTWLKNSIRVIDRPHGQHAVVLEEDAPKYMDFRNERNDLGQIVSGSRQIYMTFPAESTFTEEDVSSYFSTFGLVHDVRILCQQKQMFGFVTFAKSFLKILPHTYWLQFES